MAHHLKSISISVLIAIMKTDMHSRSKHKESIALTNDVFLYLLKCVYFSIYAERLWKKIQ